MIRTALLQITSNYLAASQGPFAGNPVAQYLRQDAPREVQAALPDAGHIIRGSPGQGTWTTAPWIALFDPVITTSAMRGYYVVYLFATDMSRVYLSLNQGTTAVRAEFGQGTVAELQRRARLMRARVPEHAVNFPLADIDLAASGGLAADYEAGHACGVEYIPTNVPTETELAQDLTSLLALYHRLTARGGLDTLEEDQGAAGQTTTETILEQRRYRLHRKIDRNSRAAARAKRIHGYRCQACGIDFEAIYGELGRAYIEAHHLTPLSELPEDVPVPQDPETDFAVLCANCHRMIHRSGGPRTVEELRTFPGVQGLRGYFGR